MSKSAYPLKVADVGQDRRSPVGESERRLAQPVHRRGGRRKGGGDGDRPRVSGTTRRQGEAEGSAQVPAQGGTRATCGYRPTIAMGLNPAYAARRGLST